MIAGKKKRIRRKGCNLHPDRPVFPTLACHIVSRIVRSERMNRRVRPFES